MSGARVTNKPFYFWQDFGVNPRYTSPTNYYQVHSASLNASREIYYWRAQYLKELLNSHSPLLQYILPTKHSHSKLIFLTKNKKIPCPIVSADFSLVGPISRQSKADPKPGFTTLTMLPTPNANIFLSDTITLTFVCGRADMAYTSRGQSPREWRYVSLTEGGWETIADIS